MKLSTTATYGLRICFLLAVADKMLSLSSLVEQTDLSEKYLEQILGKLRKNGIVSAKRGISGGYYLTKPAKEISVRGVLDALNSGFEFADCAAGDCSDLYCPNKLLFRRIYSAVNEIVTTTTLRKRLNNTNGLKKEN